MDAVKYEAIITALNKNIVEFLARIGELLKHGLHYKQVRFILELLSIKNDTTKDAQYANKCCNFNDKSVVIYNDTRNFNISQMLKIFKATNAYQVLTHTFESYFECLRQLLEKVPPEILENCENLLNLNRKMMKTLNIFLKISLIDRNRLEKCAQSFVNYLLKIICQHDFSQAISQTNTVSYHLPASFVRSFKDVEMFHAIVINEINEVLENVEDLMRNNRDFKMQDTHHEIFCTILLLLQTIVDRNVSDAEYMKSIKMDRSLFRLQEILAKEHHYLLVHLIDKIAGLD